MAEFELVETVDGKWMVLVGGVQWGAGPRDRSGCSSQTWPTKEEARRAISGLDSLGHKRLTVDGTCEDGTLWNCDDKDVSTNAPFYVHDSEKQDWIAGPFDTRREAENWIASPLTKGMYGG